MKNPFTREVIDKAAIDLPVVLDRKEMITDCFHMLGRDLVANHELAFQLTMKVPYITGLEFLATLGADDRNKLIARLEINAAGRADLARLVWYFRIHAVYQALAEVHPSFSLGASFGDPVTQAWELVHGLTEKRWLLDLPEATGLLNPSRVAELLPDLPSPNRRVDPKELFKQTRANWNIILADRLLPEFFHEYARTMAFVLGTGAPQTLVHSSADPYLFISRLGRVDGELHMAVLASDNRGATASKLHLETEPLTLLCPQPLTPPRLAHLEQAVGSRSLTIKGPEDVREILQRDTFAAARFGLADIDGLLWETRYNQSLAQWFRANPQEHSGFNPELRTFDYRGSTIPFGGLLLEKGETGLRQQIYGSVDGLIRQLAELACAGNPTGLFPAPIRFPLVVDLLDFVEQGFPALNSWLHNWWAKHLDEHPPGSFVELNLHLGRFVVLLDGLDEVPGGTQAELASSIGVMTDTWPATTFLITSHRRLKWPTLERAGFEYLNSKRYCPQAKLPSVSFKATVQAKSRILFVTERNERLQHQVSSSFNNTGFGTNFVDFDGFETQHDSFDHIYMLGPTSELERLKSTITRLESQQPSIGKTVFLRNLIPKKAMTSFSAIDVQATELWGSPLLGRRLLGDWLTRQNETPSLGRLLGGSAIMQSVFGELRSFAPLSDSILLQGETGTGKTLAALELHRLSERPGELVEANCSAMPSDAAHSELFGHEKGAYKGAIVKRIGLLTRAKQGTVFLDDVSGLSNSSQAKLLEVIENKKVRPLGADVFIPIHARLLFGSSHDLEEEIGAKRFRSDLFHRINAFKVTLPALRDRKEDIPLLIRYFEVSIRNNMEAPVPRPLSIAPEAWDLLFLHDWPGNVRELISMVRYALIIRKTDEPLSKELVEKKLAFKQSEIDPAMLAFDPYSSWAEIQQKMKLAYFKNLLNTASSRKEALALSGLSKASFYAILHELNLR